MAIIQNLEAFVQSYPAGLDSVTDLQLSQNENGRQIRFTIGGVTIPAGSVATISGTKPDGVVYSNTGTIEGSDTVIFDEDVQMTAVFGTWYAKIRITNAGNTIASARVRFIIDKDPVDAGAIPSESQLNGLVAEAEEYAGAAEDAAERAAITYGSPLTAATASAMTDINRVYVYTGSESGYTYGNWYYYNGSAWVSGGVYNSAAVETDTTLTESGVPADAKATGDKIDELKDDLEKVAINKSYVVKGYENSTVFASGIGGNIYKFSENVIPANTVVESVKIKSNVAVASGGYLFILNSDNVIIDKYYLSSASQGWNTIAINKRYSEDAYIAVRSMSVQFTYTTTPSDNFYSVGLYEANGDSYGGRVVGQTIPFTQNVPTRYYQFCVEINCKSIGIDGIIDAVYALSNPSDLSTPKMQKTGETGYSLFGKWYKMTDQLAQCANCGGASIAFKVKGATSVSVDIEQLMHHDDPAYLMTEEPFIAYSVDGASFTRVQISTNTEESVKTITIPSTSEHLVWIVIDGMCQSSGGANRSTGWSGIYIKSITSDGTLYKVRPENKKILFVGDSMIEGIDTLGTTSLSMSNSNTAEWAFKSALKLNSFPIMQGYGGTTTWSGAQFELYSRPDYNSDTFIVDNYPDLIVCEYGHNDYSLIVGEQKTETEFITQYRYLLELLSQRYPGIPIVLIIPFAQRLQNAIKIVSDTKPYYYLVQTYDYDYATLDGTHPSAASATAIAESFYHDMLKIFGKSFFM